ncbi:hypothetical protein ABMC88_04645 [Sulfitobacter sp. HNIBRBA2951]|uniref:hypothetical protein n=1 Tax=Sulfitobacter aquimarinus TaxID=3158557 RepID=UPI0032E0483F
MRTDEGQPISRLAAGQKPLILSKIAGVRCPTCNALQPIYRMNRTNPHKGWNKVAAHECSSCKSWLYFDGKGRYRRFFLIGAPLFLLSAGIGAEAVTHIDGLHHFHEARGGSEGNFLGFLVTVFLFVIPTVFFTSRFESVQTLEKNGQI